MAVGADEKTEPATPRRKQDSRNQGKVARSQDLSVAALLFVALWTLDWFGPAIWNSLVVIMRAGLAWEEPTQLDTLFPFATAVVLETLKRLAPSLVILFLVVFVIVGAQIGILFTTQPLMPSLNKVNPINGFKRLFSPRTVMTAVINIGKLLVVGAVAYITFLEFIPAILYTVSLGAYQVFQLGASLTFQMGMRISAVLLVMALLDFAWQRYKHEKDMRMTKEEVKDELRSMEGDPKVKSRRRQAQLQLSMQRLKKDVQDADVVVTNPTHLAVAIKYDATTMPAPKVVAKGADYMALRIRQLAAEYGIPIVERKPLARALYHAVEVGEEVPEKLYHAIAEILAYIYELTGKSPVGAKPTMVGA